VTIVRTVLIVLLYLFLLFLIGRLILEYVQRFARSWRPTGVVLVLAEAT
jgi:YggT family protein